MKHRRVALALVLFSLGALSTACSGSSSSPGAPGSDGAAEDAPLFDGGATGDADDAPAPVLDWMPCQKAMECATLEVPRGDGGEKVQLAVVRHRATSSEPHLGVLLFNPGGPGVASVDSFTQTYASLETFIGVDIMARFDMVTFDWRGLGHSTPSVACGGDAVMEALATIDLAPSRPDPAGFDEAVADFVTACTAGTDAGLLASLDSETVARDMDRLRIALGEEKINYLGISYGTWLGATYATMFPDRVRAFVLDSSLAPHADRRDLALDLARGVEEALPEFFAWCDTPGGPCKLAADVGTTTAAEAFDEVIKKLETTPAPAGTRKLTAMLAMMATRNQLMGGAGRYGELWYSLSEAWKGNGARMLAGASAVLGRNGAGHFDGSFAARLAISGVDLRYPEGFTKEQYLAFRADMATQFPRNGWFAASYDLVNVRWPARRPTPARTIAAPTAPPLLLLGGKHDPATNFDQTLRLQKALGNGSYVVAAEGQGHYQISQNECAALAAGAFLVEPSKAPAQASCPP